MRPQPHRPLLAIRLRAAVARAPGGASSLLRLSAGASRLPSGSDVGQWIGRAALALRTEA